jgi:hypothetical protein
MFSVSSHGRYGNLVSEEMVRGRIGCSAVGGGGLEEVRALVNRKWGGLEALRCVLLCVGGNDVSRRRGGVQVSAVICMVICVITYSFAGSIINTYLSFHFFRSFFVGARFVIR